MESSKLQASFAKNAFWGFLWGTQVTEVRVLIPWLLEEQIGYQVLTVIKPQSLTNKFDMI